MRVKEKIQEAVLFWYRKKGRVLPWRQTTDPYKILVSEMMLQQTQVDRVIPKYYAFLEQFPTAKTLATSQTAQVLRLWSGLGYNRRALYLQKCSQIIETQYHGIFPQTEYELEQLPGIGPYTRAAVLSFAYNKNVVVIDVNIELLYKRLFYGKADTIHAIAENLLPIGKSRDWHNALMDIGALFCTAKNPKCNDCVVQQFCASKNNPINHETTRQKKKVIPFKESDRIVRGTILKLLTRKNNQKKDQIYMELQKQNIGRQKEKFEQILVQLEKDGLVKRNDTILSLP